MLMSESLQVALVALTGVAFGGLLTDWFHRENTKTLVTAELTKLRLQLDGEAHVRLLGRKQDILMEVLAELVAAADPELHEIFDYGKVVTLIHRAQLLLNPTRPVEATLNDAISKLGFSIQAAVSGSRDLSEILRAQSSVIEAGRSVLNQAF